MEILAIFEFRALVKVHNYNFKTATYKFNAVESYTDITYKFNAVESYTDITN